MFYLSNIILVVVYYLILVMVVNNVQQRNKYFYILVSIHAILVRILANPSIFLDTINYENAYVIIGQSSYKEISTSRFFYADWGIGYVFLNWCLYHISHTPLFLFVSFGFVSVLLTMFVYSKTSVLPLVTVFFYFLHPMLYYQGFYVIRQHMSIPLVLLAIYKIDNLKLSLLLIMLASTIHTSAIVIIPLLLGVRFVKSNLNKKSIFAILIIFIVFLRLYIGNLLSYSSRYDELLNGEESLNILPVIYLSVVVVLFLKNGIYNRNSSSIDKYFVLFITYGLGISIFCIGLPGMGRLSSYFLYALPIGLSIVYKRTNSFNMDMTISLILIFSVVVFQLLAKGSSIVDYDYIWNRSDWNQLKLLF